jgi:hypothetical protein
LVSTAPEFRDANARPKDFENHAAEAEKKARDLAMKVLDGIAAVLDPDIAAENRDPREWLFRWVSRSQGARWPCAGRNCFVGCRLRTQA